MALEQAFLDLMVDTVTVTESASTRNLDGTLSYTGTTHTFKARAQAGHKGLRKADKEQVVPTLVLYIPPTDTNGVAYTPTPEDLLTLADGSTPLIVGVYPVRDERGPHHTQIYCRNIKGFGGGG